jgi:signal transduction histidine kinase/DNA-binding response OmpR family regulator
VSELLTRKYLRSHYWIATGGIVVCLLVSIVVGGTGLQDVKADARYAAALTQLMRTENWFQVQLAWASTAPPSDRAEGVDVALTESFADFLQTFIALRAADSERPDALAHPDRSVDEQWKAMTKTLGINLKPAVDALYLDGEPMPSSLRELWRGRGRSAAGLEKMLNDIIVRGYPLVSGGGVFSPEAQTEARQLITLSSTRLRPALENALATITLDTARDASYAFKVLLGAGLLGVTIAGVSVIFIFSPMERAILGGQRLLVSERDTALASERAKRDFLAMMSHELRTPMNGILGFTNLLLSTPLSAKQKDYVETIHSSGVTLLDLLNDILDISKIEAGSIELESEEFSIADIVTNVVTLLGPRAFAKRLDLGAYVDPSLPEKMRGDAGRLRQVLINLVGNAIKFTSSGGVAIEVKLEGHCEGGGKDGGQDGGKDGGHDILMTVTDTGIGVPKEQLGRIFERFTQVDASLSRNYEGAGLGLPICKQFIELMGGQIGVDSIPDQGSAFWVRLSLGAAVPPAEKISEALDVDLCGRRLLIVDDTPLNRRIFRLQLEGFGAVVDCAPDGRSALDMLSRAVSTSCPFELAVIDQMMPEMDGVTLRNFIRQEPGYNSLKLILSSSGGVDSDEHAIRLGFDAACPKPVTQEKLVRVIHDMLSNESSASANGPEPVVATAADVEAEATDERLDASEDGAAAGSEKGRKPRLLVAEDNAANQRLILAVLENAGYIVDIVADGVEAVHAAQRLPYDLILMDIRMPVMGGIEATRRIRSLNSPAARCPILALTANAMVGDREEYLAAGMNDYISKPIDLKGLVAKIKHYLDAAAAGDRAA